MFPPEVNPGVKHFTVVEFRLKMSHCDEPNMNVVFGENPNPVMVTIVPPVNVQNPIRSPNARNLQCSKAT